MSIPEQISGISLGSAYIRPGTVGAITSVTYIAGSWITVDTTGSLFTIDQSRTSTGQLAFVSQSQQFYIATKVPADFITTFDDTVSWAPFTFSGSFSGSFSGDGSGLTGIASSLYLSGSTGSDTVNLKTDALTLTGSAQGIVVAVSDNKATFTISNTAVITGSFKGDGSGLTGVAAAPAGNDKTVQFRSGSAVAGAVDFIYDHTTGNVGIGTTVTPAKLTVDGDVIVTGKITAEEFHTEFVSASIIYQSGSTKFGNSIDDDHQFTGSLSISGSVRAFSYSGSFIGDGSQLTGIATSLIITGSTGNDSLNLKTDSLTITGSARNIDVAVTDNTVTISVPNNLQLTNVNLTGSFTGNFSGSIDAVILNALSASYSGFAVTASYATFAATSISASYAATASSADSFTVRTALTASGLRYPTADGIFTGQVIQTNAAGTLSIGNVSAVFENIRNGEATTIAVGTPLYVSGALGDQPICYRADASDPTKMPVTFLAMEEIAAGQGGRGITLGLITGINMTGYPVGTVLYVNGLGLLTDTRPTGSTSITQPIGIVTKTGNGGQLNVLNPGPVLLPNIQTGYTWIGDSQNQPVAVPTSSLVVNQAISSSYAVSSSFASSAVTASYATLAASVGILSQSLTITGNLTVFGTSSFTYTTASVLVVDDPFIFVNVFTPLERFGGLKVIDSGSLNGTASLAWDSQRNHWIYQNSSGSDYSGGGFMSGPRHTGSLGDETYPTLNTVLRGQGGDHLYDSNIKDNDVAVQVGIPLQVTGSVIVTQNVVAQSFTGSFTGSFAGSVANAVTASFAITALTASHAITSVSASYLFPDAQYGENFTLSSPAANQVRLTRPSGTTSTATFTVATASHALTAVTASHAIGYAKGSGQTGEVTTWQNNETVSGSSWLRVTSSIDGFGTPALLIDGNYYSYAQSATGGNGFVAFSGSLTTTASIMGVNVSQFEGQLYSSNGAEVRSAIRLSSLYTDAYTIGRFLTPGADNLLRIAPDVLILGSTTTINGDLVVGGKVTAEEFHTEFVSASIIYRSGSTKFGDTSDDVHQFTGSVSISTQLYAGLDTEVLPNIVGYNSSTGELTYYASSSVRATPIPGGSDNQVQYNDNGTMAGASGFVWTGTSVGIGTSAPVYTLVVDGDSSEGAIGIERTTVGSNTVIGAVNFTNNNGGTVYGRVRGGRNAAGDGYVSLGTGLGDNLYALEGGNVGIGTSNPLSKLQVNKSSQAYTSPTASGALVLSDTAGTGAALDMGVNATYLSYIQSRYLDSSAVYQLLLNPGGGNIGIGTTNADALLHLVSTSPLVKLTNTSAGAGAGSIQFYSGSTQMWNLGTHTDNDFYLYNNSTTGYSLWVDSATGNVGIGVANPTKPLHVAGAIRFSSYGGGSITGTATKTLAVDSSGNVIELDVSSNGTGAANQVAFWKDTDTVSGSAALTWNGTTFYINGTLEATEKSFVIDHPILPGKKLVYGVLEGPEHAVYCRGKISGEVIQLPEEWTGLVDQESITVQLTPIGKHQNLYVVDIKDNKVFIKNGDLLTSKISAYYYIQATRKDIKPLTTVREA